MRQLLDHSPIQWMPARRRRPEPGSDPVWPSRVLAAVLGALAFLAVLTGRIG